MNNRCLYVWIIDNAYFQLVELVFNDLSDAVG